MQPGFAANVLHGPNYTATLPPGFVPQQVSPGAYIILPPGVAPPVIPALVSIEPVHPMFEAQQWYELQSLSNPMVAQAMGQRLGFANAHLTSPIREQWMGQTMVHQCELEAVAMPNMVPVRLLVMRLKGHTGTANVIIAIHLWAWPQYLGTCLQFVGGVNVNGSQPLPAPPVQAVFNPSQPQQVEMRVNQVPITTVPNQAGSGTVIQYIDNRRYHVNGIKDAQVVFEGDMDNSRSFSNTGSISGSNVNLGDQVNQTLGAAQTAELQTLLAELRQRVAEADIPEPAKAVIVAKAVAPLEEAAAKGEAKPADVQGKLEKVNDQLEGLGTTGDKVLRIAETVKKIAGVVGIGLSAAAPFLARFIG
ncbi:MAG: hypothetical protein SFV18_09315 [Bryobacteraceae bacterium]|nr:hypothetical protein [Bryobacteraceae bacterium]